MYIIKNWDRVKGTTSSCLAEDHANAKLWERRCLQQLSCVSTLLSLIIKLVIIASPSRVIPPLESRLH